MNSLGQLGAELRRRRTVKQWRWVVGQTRRDVYRDMGCPQDSHQDRDGDLGVICICGRRCAGSGGRRNHNGDPDSCEEVADRPTRTVARSYSVTRSVNLFWMQHENVVMMEAANSRSMLKDAICGLALRR